MRETACAPEQRVRRVLQQLVLQRVARLAHRHRLPLVGGHHVLCRGQGAGGRQAVMVEWNCVCVHTGTEMLSLALAYTYLLLLSLTQHDAHTHTQHDALAQYAHHTGHHTQQAAGVVGHRSPAWSARCSVPSPAPAAA